MKLLLGFVIVYSVFGRGLPQKTIAQEPLGRGLELGSLRVWSFRVCGDVLALRNPVSPNDSQWVHVGMWYILKAQRGSHTPGLRPKYILYSYMDPLGFCRP